MDVCFSPATSAPVPKVSVLYSTRRLAAILKERSEADKHIRCGLLPPHLRTVSRNVGVRWLQAAFTWPSTEISASAGTPVLLYLCDNNVSTLRHVSATVCDHHQAALLQPPSTLSLSLHFLSLIQCSKLRKVTLLFKVKVSSCRLKQIMQSIIFRKVCVIRDKRVFSLSKPCFKLPNVPSNVVFVISFKK